MKEPQHDSYLLIFLFFLKGWNFGSELQDEERGWMLERAFWFLQITMTTPLSIPQPTLCRIQVDDSSRAKSPEASAALE